MTQLQDPNASGQVRKQNTISQSPNICEPHIIMKAISDSLHCHYYCIQFILERKETFTELNKGFADRVSCILYKWIKKIKKKTMACKKEQNKKQDIWAAEIM